MEKPMMGWYGDGGWWGAGMVAMVVFWVAVVAAVVWAVARLTRRAPAARQTPESARQVLDRRFAAGELDEEQYARARRVLEGHGVDSGAA
jgi:putative membrane protein